MPEITREQIEAYRDSPSRLVTDFDREMARACLAALDRAEAANAELAWCMADGRKRTAEVADLRSQLAACAAWREQDKAEVGMDEENDICGLCGEPGADKLAHPVHWPGERVPDGPLVHRDCEDEECRRAHALLSDEERVRFLRSI